MWPLQHRSGIRFHLRHDLLKISSIAWGPLLLCSHRIVTAFQSSLISVDWRHCSHFPEMRLLSCSLGFVPPAVLLHVTPGFAPEARAREVPALSHCDVVLAFCLCLCLSCRPCLCLYLYPFLPSPPLPLSSPFNRRRASS